MDVMNIKLEPLTPEGAAELNRMIGTVTISAASAMGLLMLRGALDRIARGVDVVSPALVEKEDSQGSKPN